MAHPKRKTSKARRNRRRTFYRLTASNTIKCNHCGQSKMPHHVCQNCGFYRSEQVITKHN